MKNNQITVLSIRRFGDENDIFVFNGHLKQTTIQPQINNWLRQSFDGDVDEPIEQEHYFVDIQHDMLRNITD